MDLLILPAVLFLLALCSIEGCNILLCNQKLTGIIFCLRVLYVGPFFAASTSAYSTLSSFTLKSFFTPNSSKAALTAL